MTISCGCYDDGYEWYYVNQEQKPLATKRSRKCCSCGCKIAVGELSTEFYRYKSPESEYEERRFGDEVPMTPWYMCETCGDLFDSYKEAGYCISLTEGENLQKGFIDRD